MKIGAMELVLIFIVALIVIGPDKLPAYARKFGNALRAFREASSDITQEFRESVVEPLEEAQKPLRDAMEPLEEINREIRENVKGVECDLNNLGKKKPAGDSAENGSEAQPDSASADSDSDEIASGSISGSEADVRAAPASAAESAAAEPVPTSERAASEADSSAEAPSDEAAAETL